MMLNPKPNQGFQKIRKKFSQAGEKTLNGIEWMGNKFPKPFYLFLYFVIILMFVSMILHYSLPDGVVLKGLNEDKPVTFFNLLGRDGIIWWLKNFIPNFMTLPTTGIVIITTIFVCVAEKSGFIDVAMRKVATSIPKRILTPTIIFIGCLTNLAADAGYLILIPLAGILYYRAGRHPLAGIAAVFAGVSGGFVTSLLPGTVDVIMASLTDGILGKGSEHLFITAMSTYFFSVVLLFVYTLVGWFVTDVIVEKRLLKRYQVIKRDDVVIGEKVVLTAQQRKGMWSVLLFVLIYFLAMILMIFIPGGPFSGMIYTVPNIPSGFSVGDYSPLNHLALIIGFLFLGIGIVYGFVAKTFKSRNDVVNALIIGFKKAVPALILFLVMSQFIAALNQSNVGTVMGYFLGAGLVKINSPVLVLFLFIIIVAIFNLFMAGLSSKWGILGPIFLIALSRAGIHPAAVVAAYRVGDSATNLIAPLMPYFPLILIWAKEWVAPQQREKFEMGSLMSMMFPYSMAFLFFGTTIFLIWVATGANLGVGGPIQVVQESQTLISSIKPVITPIQLLNSVPFHFVTHLIS